MIQAFILGAGLGTRLRPLTDRMPKPLVPLFHRPLADWAVDACTRVGISRFAINTHHLPAKWEEYSDQPAVRDLDIAFFHEPILLETGGGLKNIASWVGEDPLLIHNGDIFSTIPLEKLIAAHKASGLPATLALRSDGPARHIAVDASLTHVTDIRRQLGRADGTHLFTGIYCVNPDFLELLPENQKISIIPAFLELARAGRLGAVVLDEGTWLDLGDRDSYLQAHQELDLGPAIHPLASVNSGATVENSIVGPGSVIDSGAIIRNSVIWPNCHITGQTNLDRCVVCSPEPITGTHQNVDL